MKFLLCALVLFAVSEELSATMCPHGDISNCGLTCTNDGETVGCEHDTCTCVAQAPSCSVDADCDGPNGALHCKPHEQKICLNDACACYNPPPECHHDDISNCNVTCADTLKVGCDHDKCTCLAGVGSTCAEEADCHGMHCEHHLHKKCLSGQCACAAH